MSASPFQEYSVKQVQVQSLFALKHNTMFITIRHNQSTVKTMQLHAVDRRA